MTTSIRKHRHHSPTFPHKIHAQTHPTPSHLLLPLHDPRVQRSLHQKNSIRTPTPTPTIALLPTKHLFEPSMPSPPSPTTHPSALCLGALRHTASTTLATTPYPSHTPVRTSLPRVLFSTNPSHHHFQTILFTYLHAGCSALDIADARGIRRGAQVPRNGAFERRGRACVARVARHDVAGSTCGVGGGFVGWEACGGGCVGGA